VQVRPLGLEPLLEVVEDLRGASGRGREQEAIVAKSHDDAVVHDHAVEPEHDAVADRAGAQ
jgi:hypothetical protein